MTRILIGALLLVLVLIANLGGQLGVSLLTLVFSLVALKEAFRILEKQEIAVPKILVSIFICLFHLLGVMIPDKFERFFVVVLLSHLSLFFLFSVSFLTLEYLKKIFKLNTEKHFIQSILLLAYLGLAPSFYPLIRGLASGDLFFLTIIISVALNDTFALVGGKTFGLIPLTKTISPNKKIEGSLSGLLLGSISFSICILSFHHGLDPQITSLIGSFLKQHFDIIRYKVSFINYAFVFILGLGIAIIAQLGDLFESMLKRRARVKDSGSILLAQGGILDRIDSHYFAVGFAYLIFYFCIR